MIDLAGTLLLVDDDEAKRYVLASWLRRAGHTVTEAATGQEALGMVAAADLVLLDVNLPDMSGFEVCRLIKSNPRTAAIPVIQVSATAVEVADRAHGLTQGADAYLVEPTEPAELLATVTAALRYYRARRRAERTAAMLTALASVTLGHQRRRDLRRAGGGGGDRRRPDLLRAGRADAWRCPTARSAGRRPARAARAGAARRAARARRPGRRTRARPGRAA